MNNRMEIKNLSRYFKDGKKVFKAVDDISFNIEPGKILSILGPNGAGKTTTIQMISGYLNPTSGSILINGTEINNKGKKQLGVAFGGEQGFYNKATAKENLIFFANLSKIPRKILKNEVSRVLEIVELKNVENKNVGEFSRGMRQRLHIARALLGNPGIILLDEPTNGLDVEIAHEIRKVILNLKKSGIAVLLTSHAMTEIEALTDHIILLGSGKIYYEGSIESIMDLAKKEANVKNLEEAYLVLAKYLKREIV